MKRLVFMVFAIFLMVQNIFASEKENLKTEFLAKINEIVMIVGDKTISKDERNDNVVKAITPMFDFELMAKLSLGKVWKSLDKTDRKKFVDLYVKRMKNSYSSKLDSYSDEKVVIKSMKQPKTNRIYIDTDLVGSNNNLEVKYKFYKPRKPMVNKKDWLVYDVEILGVSILKTDMAQFREFLKNRSIKQLMEEIKKQVS